MEKIQETGGWSQEKRQVALEKVRKFCEQWGTANIVSFLNGECVVERLDDKNEQIGVYKFDNNGELNEFTASNGPAVMDKLVADLTSDGVQVEVVKIKKKKETAPTVD